MTSGSFLQLSGGAAERRRNGAGGGLRQRHHLLQRHRRLHLSVCGEHAAAGKHPFFKGDSHSAACSRDIPGNALKSSLLSGFYGPHPT